MKIIKNILFLMLVVSLTFVSMNCSSKKVEKVEKSEYRLNYSGKTKVVVENTNGYINVNKSDSVTGLLVKAEIKASVRKKDIDKPLKDVKVEIDSTSDIITIKGIGEKFEIVFFGKSHHSEINFDIYIPDSLNLQVDNTNGKVSISGINKDVEASVTNGSITAKDCNGKGSYDITNGSFTGDFDSTKGLKVEIVNGGITINAGKNFSARISAEYVNGSFKYENIRFDNVDNEDKTFKGMLGNSDNEVNLNVVNGKIKVVGR